MTARRGPAIAVVGIGLVVPGAASPEEFWDLLMDGRPQFAEPDDRWDLRTLHSPEPRAEDRVLPRRLGYIRDFSAHPRTDADPPRGLDELGRWLRHAVAQALEKVRIRPDDHCLVSVGATSEGSQRLEERLVMETAAKLLCDHGLPPDQTVPILEANHPRAGADCRTHLPPNQVRAAVRDLLPRPCEISVVDAACSSASYAVGNGRQALIAGDCDIAVCGASFVLCRRTNVLFSQAGVYAPTGDLRAFDRAASGTLFSDGTAAVILKTHDRALADGDHIYGFVRAAAGASDGRGKGIMAPNPRGQLLALRRALEQAGMAPEDLQWVLGHGTGTRIGDARELEMLRTAVDGRGRWLVTSNKSLVGHTGWAAGIVSLIHALLALKHEQIPAQHRFEAVRDPERLGTSLTIPVNPVSWPSSGAAQPRAAAICAYGVGGVNCCLVLSDQPGATDQPLDDEIVLVSWHAHLPGHPTEREVERWLATGERGWPDAFPTPYPPLAGEVTTLPPATHGSLDRAHLMTMHAAHQLAERARRCWRAQSDTTAVYLAHCGPTKGSIDYALRASAEDLSDRIGPDLFAGTEMAGAGFVDAVRTRVKRADSDTFTGFISNVMASRVAVQFDLHGPAMAFDAGSDSALAAGRVACRELRAGNIDFALLFAVCGNAEHGPLVSGQPARSVREGVFAFVLTRGETARRHRLASLAAFDTTCADEASSVLDPISGHEGFLGADAAIRLLRAVTSHRTYRVNPIENDATPPITVRTPKATVSPTTATRKFRPTAFVSGGGTGIGLSTALALADDGVQVTIFGRRREPLEQAADQISTAGGRAHWYQVDLCSPAAVEHVVTAALDACGGTVDILVNNAGSTADRSTRGLAAAAEHWQTQWRANVLPALLLTEAVRNHLRRPGGRIVTISSYGAFLPGNPPYASAKAALHAWMYSLAAELGGQGITVNTVAPGFITGTQNQAASHVPEPTLRRFVERTPLRRPGHPQEVAAAIRWLASPAASYVTGQIIQVNGGAVFGRG